MASEKIRRALVSVSDKTGLVELAQVLKKNRVEILSTGGTLKALNEAGIPAKAVEKYTGFPEMMDGRVKTLHPKIHGGLLFKRDNAKHRKEAKKNKIEPIDLVVINLYPFEKVTSQPKVEWETAIENIDIGGPSMLRSAAKNHESVAVVCDPSDYALLISELNKNKGGVSLKVKKQLALKVFQRTAAYDAAIAGFLETRLPQASVKNAEESLPDQLSLKYRKISTLRYGENPHQQAGLYVQQNLTQTPKRYIPLHGKELSYNNILDTEGALDVIREFIKPAACVVKHSNPCGIAEGKDTADALERAIESDALSAFGGILAVNRRCDLKTVQIAFEKLHFFEVFIAPSYDPKALEFLKQRKNLRIIETGDLGQGIEKDVRYYGDGLLVQTHDKPLCLSETALKKKIKCVTQTQVTAGDIEDLIFAYKCVKTVKSNAIVLTQGRQTVGVGAGQMSRVDSVEIACRKAGDKTRGAILASDAFFPMPDSIDVAHQHQIKAIIQPGGSIKDQDVIAACDRYGIAMVFTGERHFKH